MFTATLRTVSKRSRKHSQWKNDGELVSNRGWQLNSTPSIWQNRFDNEGKHHGIGTREHIWSMKTLNYLEMAVIAPQSQSLKKKKGKKIITTTYSAPWDPGSIIINQKRFNYRETHWNAILSELQNGSRRQFLGFIVGKNKQSLISTWGDQDRRKEIFVYAQLLPADVWSHLHSEAKRFDFKGCVHTR